MIPYLGFTPVQIGEIIKGTNRLPSPWETSIYLLEMQLWMTGVVVVMLFLILLVLGVARGRR